MKISGDETSGDDFIGAMDPEKQHLQTKEVYPGDSLEAQLEDFCSL